jgi:hypothetical protein
MSKSKILVSAHDLGGANQLLYSPIGDKAHYKLSGPAKQVADKLRLENQIQADNFNISEFSKLIVASNADFQTSDQLLNDATKLGITTIGYLDHWVNFKDRWLITPDKVIVTDIMAFWNAAIVFGFKVRLHRNHYFNSLKEGFRLFQGDVNDSQALFIVQPIAFADQHDTDTLKCVCGAVKRFLEKHLVNEILIRDHFTTFSLDCTRALEAEYPSIIFSKSDWEAPLERDIFRSKYVIGYDSYALYVARKLGKRVFTTGKRRAWVSPRYRRL